MSKIYPDWVEISVRTKIASKSCKKLDKDQWVVVEGTHEPIVSYEVFSEVQNLLKEKSNKGTKRKARDIYSKECSFVVGVILQ